MITRSEKVDTRAALAGRPGDTNGTNPAQRMAERTRILEYWPSDLIVEITNGMMVAPPWRLLLRPTSWEDVPKEEVAQYVRDHLATYRKWPSVDGLQRRFGRVSNHRSGGEVAEQSSLFAA